MGKFKCLLYLLIWLVLSENTMAYGPPNYLPDATRPRMFFTPAITSTLTARMNANTAEWAALKSWCDAHIGDNALAGYQGTEWMKYAMNYALVYRMTGTSIYGAEALIYLNAMLNSNTNNGAIGSTGGYSGANAITSDSGYIARVIGFSVPVVRDWLDGYSGLNSTVIALCNQRLGEWITWYSTSGWQRNNPIDNYYAGYLQMVMSAAFGLYGDTGYQASWLTRAGTMWSDEVVPIANGLYVGGDSKDGWSYGAHHAEAFLQFPHLAETAAGDDRKWNEYNWHNDVAKSLIHQLHPNRATTDDDGVWDNAKFGWPDTLTLMDSLAEHAPIDSTLANNVRWYAANITQPRNQRSLWAAFLWYNPNGTTAIPTETSMGSLSWKTGGHFFHRSAEWSNTNATWWSVAAWPGDNTEAKRNVGELKIVSRGEQLLVSAGSNYEGQATNTLSATGTHRYAPFQDWSNTNVATLVDNGSGYTAARVINAEQAYDTEYYGTTLSHYHRNILNVGADLFVVSDTAIPISASTLGRRWFFFGNPITTSNTIRSNRTGVDLAVWADGAVSSGVANSFNYARSGTYYVDVAGAGITVFEAGNSGFTAKTVSQITGTNAKGVLIGTNTVAMYTSSATGANISSASYSTNTSASSTHYISDLNIGATYNVSINGGTATPYTASAAGIISFANGATGLQTYSVVQSGEVPPSDTTAPTLNTFTIPATATSLSVPVTSLNATDNTGVTGYLVTESTAIPSSGDSIWSASAPASVSFSSAGSKTAYAWAKDAAGNLSNGVGRPITITLMDATAPVVSAFVMPATATSQTVTIATLTATDSNGVTGYLINESSTKPSSNASGWTASAPTSFTFSSVGSKTAYAWAKDAAGNVSNSMSATVTITLPDLTAPTVSIDSPTINSTLSGTVTVTASAADNVGVSKVEFYVDSVLQATDTSSSYSFSWNSTLVTNGIHTLSAKAYDLAGNIGSSSSVSVTVTNVIPDVTAPTMNTFSMPITSTSLTVAISGLSASDAVGVTGYLVTESSTKPAASASGWTATAPTSFTFSAEGSKTVYAWAKDAAGNVSSSLNTTVTITLPDVTAPSMATFSMSTTSTTLAVAISSLTATDNRAVTGYLVTESSTKPAASASGWTAVAPTSFTFSAAGSKTAYAWAKDAAGNVSNSMSAAVTITLTVTDTTAPTVTKFTIPYISSTEKVSITSFTATDNVAVTGYLITESSTRPAANAAGWAASKPATFTTTASVGVHTLYPWVKDAVGNVSAAFGSPKKVYVVLTSKRVAYNQAKESYYTTLQQAYDGSSDGDVLLAADAQISESVASTSEKKVKILGGYDEQFASVTDYTSLQGTLTIAQGGLVVDRLIIN